MSLDQEPTPGEDVRQESEDRTDHQRRKAMVRMAAYTAPVMLAMLVGDKAMATSASGPGPFDPCETWF